MSSGVKQKIVITGASGFLGTNLNLRLKKLGVETYPVDRKNFEIIDSFPKDITHIFHFAGGSSVRGVEKNAKDDFTNTVVLTENLLRKTKEKFSNAMLIYPSSPAVFGETQGKDYEPVSFYGLHKSLVEEMIKFYGRYNSLNYRTLRLFSVYGPGLKKQLIWDAFVKLRSKKYIFSGTGHESRDWIFIDDVIDLFISMVTENRFPKIKEMDVGTGQSYSVSEVLNQIARLLNIDTNLIEFDGKRSQSNPHQMVAKSNEEVLNIWKSKVSLKEGLEKAIRHYLQTSIDPQ